MVNNSRFYSAIIINTIFCSGPNGIFSYNIILVCSKTARHCGDERKVYKLYYMNGETGRWGMFREKDASEVKIFGDSTIKFYFHFFKIKFNLKLIKSNNLFSSETHLKLTFPCLLK